MLANTIYVSNPLLTYFFNNDSTVFYKWAALVSSYDYYIGPSIFDYTHNWVRTGSGFFLLSFAISKFLKIFNVDYTFLAQISQVPFFASLTLTVLHQYFFIVPKFNKNKIKKYVLLFGFFSPLMVYSAVYIRDIYIVFIYALAFLIMLKPFSNFNLIKIFSLCFLASLFRIESGIALLLLPIIYLIILDKNKRKSFSQIIRVVVLVSTVIAIYGSLNFLSNEFINPTTETYEEGQMNRYESADGLSSYITVLPKPLQYFANFAISQIKPFPITNSIYEVGKTTKGGVSKDLGRVQYLSFTYAIGGFFWFIIWFIIINTLYKNFKSFWTDKNKLKQSFLVALIILASVTFVTPEFRRALGVYPLIYVFALYQIKDLSFHQTKEMIFKGFLAYVLLHIIYLFMKI